MPITNYEITGRVVNARTDEGLYNLRVEAWDRDEKYNDLLGSAVTDADGGFSIAFDSTYFREYAPDTAPELFFKIYRGSKMIQSSEQTPIRNAREREEVTIRVDVPGVQSTGRDRVTTAQVFKAADFFRESDFRGVYEQFRGKAGTSLGLIADLVSKTLGGFDFEPIKVRGVRENEVVNRDVATVRRNLESRKIEVNSVRTYEPRLNVATLKSVTTLPFALRAGQRVDLYEENGIVRYYALVDRKAIDDQKEGEVIEAQKKQLEEMHRALSETRNDLSRKETEIVRLRDEVEVLRKNHDEIKSMLVSDNLIERLKDLQKPAPPAKRRSPRKPKP
jgi:hypothetical protein